MARRSTRTAAAAPQQLSSPPATPAPIAKRHARRGVDSPLIKEEQITPRTSANKKRKRAQAKAESSPEDGSKALVTKSNGIPSPSTDADATPAKKKRAPVKKKTPIKTDPDDVEKIAEKAGIVSPAAGSASAKKNGKKSVNYGLTPGSSPYPTYDHPTAEECHEVVRLLSKVHGRVSAPKEIRAPSLTTAGCGEVPSVLDALIRTRLSAATTGANSSRAFQGLVKAFGTIDTGVGRGSVNWGNVRRASQQEVFEAIKCGGLAGSKSKDIKAILDLVWEENQERATALKTEDKADPAGAEGEDEAEKKLEVSRADEGVPSLDHLHLLSNEEAFNKLVSYPGIGPKTASCVLLFCLQRPSFAVDTHVFRLCRYLGWVPSDAEAKARGWPRVERNSTYAHCEVRVPDELKYALHQLLIKHGKSCGRCRAATGIGSEGWKKGCPIDHLVKRHGAKKGEFSDDVDDDDEGIDGVAGSGRKYRGRKQMSDGESEEAEMSDLGSDEDDEASVSAGSSEDD